MSPARWALGSFSAAGCPPFAGYVVDPGAADPAVIAVAALQAVAAEAGGALLGVDSVLGLVDQWPHNLPLLDGVAAALAAETSGAGRGAAASAVAMSRLRVHAPIAPRQVVMAGANYFKHVVDLIVDQGPGGNPDTEDMAESELRTYAEALMTKRKNEGTPYLFLKPVSALTGAFDTVLLPSYAKKPDWELELAVVIGKPARNVALADALGFVAGYTIANDLTNRDWVYTRGDMKALGTDWLAGKGCPTYLPLGPFIVPAAQVGDPQVLRLHLALNGETKQDESTADMIFGVARLVEHASRLLLLLPGDVICTGSPSGNGTHYNRFLRPGDVIESSITGLGRQRNPVAAAPAAA